MQLGMEVQKQRLRDDTPMHSKTRLYLVGSWSAAMGKEK